MASLSEEMKRRLQVLGVIADAGGDISHQQVDEVTPAPDQPQLDAPSAGEDLQVSAPPVRQPLVPRAPVEPPAPLIAPKPPVDAELAAAKGSDVDAFNARASEMAARQIVGGITRTAVPDSVNQLGTGEKDLLAQRRQAKIDQLRELEAGNNAARTDAYLKTNEAAGPRADRKLTLDEEEAARREARARAEQVLKEAAAQEAARHNKQTEGIGWKNANKPAGGAPAERDADGNLVPKTYRDQLRANGVALRPDEELIDPKGIGYRDAEQAKHADTLRGNLAKLEEHRAQANAALEEFHAAKGAKEQDDALVKLNIAMSNAASMIRQSENMGASVDAQHTIDQMVSTSGGDVKNWRNFINEGRIDAALGAAVTSASANVEGQLAHTNVRIKKAGTKGAAPGENGPQRKTLKSGAVVEKHADGLWYPVEG